MSSRQITFQLIAAIAAAFIAFPRAGTATVPAKTLNSASNPGDGVVERFGHAQIKYCFKPEGPSFSPSHVLSVEFLKYFCVMKDEKIFLVFENHKGISPVDLTKVKCLYRLCGWKSFIFTARVKNIKKTSETNNPEAVLELVIESKHSQPSNLTFYNGAYDDEPLIWGDPVSTSLCNLDKLECRGVLSKGLLRAIPIKQISKTIVLD